MKPCKTNAQCLYDNFFGLFVFALYTDKSLSSPPPNMAHTVCMAFCSIQSSVCHGRIMAAIDTKNIPQMFVISPTRSVPHIAETST